MSPQPPRVRPVVQRASAQLRQALVSSRRVLLSGPADPDGDSIGACLALADGMRQLTRATIDVAGVATYRYAWMPGVDRMVADADVLPIYDLVIVIDGDRRRLSPQVTHAFAQARLTGIIDHHRSTGSDGYDLPLLDPRAASACDLVYELLLSWGLSISRSLAQLLYAGLVFDTGGFRHSNTTPHTHMLAATLIGCGIDHVQISAHILMERSRPGLRLLGEVLSAAHFYADGRLVIGAASRAQGHRLGAGAGDIDGIVDHLVSTRGTELACLFIEQDPKVIKLSLRSNKTVDVAALARRISPSGGGHARAAGALQHGSLDTVIAGCLPLFLTALSGQDQCGSPQAVDAGSQT